MFSSRRELCRSAFKYCIPFPGFKKDNVKVSLSADKKDIVVNAHQRIDSSHSFSEKTRIETIPIQKILSEYCIKFDLAKMTYNLDEEHNEITISIPPLQEEYVTIFQANYPYLDSSVAATLQNCRVFELSIKDNMLRVEVLHPRLQSCPKLVQVI